MGVDEAELEQHAVLDGAALSDPIEAGRHLKIVR